MSARTHERLIRRLGQHAALFAALGDQTRLMILVKLADGVPQSITRLSEGSDLTRQAITKHLTVLEDAGLVTGSRQGRENLFQIESDTLATAHDALDAISKQWDATLDRLKKHVEGA
ncbi:MAG: transcriptional regulator [Phycisphaeraceae bacterium]|nr:transcriptional regulator [Phycisphaeraceae bacterium]